MLRISILRLSFALLTAIVLSACTQPAQTPHFTYEGEDGPQHWGELDAAWAVCASGKSQSPIDLKDAASEDLANIAFHYRPSQVRILNNGHTAQVNYDAGSYIEIDSHRFDLVQFHFHAPSEHTIAGQAFAAEMHLVHQDADKQLAVVGVLIEAGPDNPAFKPVWDHIPAQEVSETDAGVTVNAADLLPAIQTTYRYNGSLTTPPCSEGVSWFVMTTPVEMSAKQITAFEQIFHDNHRPVQTLNQRNLVVDDTP